jgi:putative Holliday junction resolvase
VSRVLALDHGAARCGVALSDPTGTLASPLTVVERPDTRRGLARIVGLVREHAVGRVVVGLPLGLSGEDTDQTRAARDFAEALAAKLRGVPVDLYDERFTTAIAARQVVDSGDVGEDARAAAVLLDDWLARHAHEAGAR